METKSNFGKQTKTGAMNLEVAESIDCNNSPSVVI